MAKEDILDTRVLPTNIIADAYEDFRVFLWIVWQAIGLPAPTPIQYDMADSLQRPPSDRFIIMAFRGAAKSFVTCAFAVWCLWRNPNLKVMIVSASKDRADANAVFVKKIIHTLHFLEHLKAGPEQRDSQNIFDVGPALPDISPSIKSVGITGQITGSRADILISDDVEVPKNSATQIQRDKLGELVREYDAILKPGGQIIYLGTPQCEASLYNELQQRGYLCRVWPLLYPEDERRLANYGRNLAPMIAEALEADPSLAGTTTEPSRFSMEEVAKRRLSYGAAGFALQFLLDTSLSDAEKYPLKLSSLIVTQLDKDSTSMVWHWAASDATRLADVPCVGMKGDALYGPFVRSKDVYSFSGGVLAIDPSGRGKDETAYAIVKFLNGFLFVMEVGGLQGGYGEAVLQTLANKAKYWNVSNVLIESNFGDGMFTQLITPVFQKVGHPVGIEEVRSTTMKEARIIDTLEPVIESHKLIVNQSVVTDDYQVYMRDPAYSLFYQMTRICREKGALAHDDRLDALAMAVRFWLDYMAVDAEKGVEAKREDWLEAQLNKPEVTTWELDINGYRVLMTDAQDDLLNLRMY
ncbi:DNA maturase B [Chromobacterium violaceum]|uniref:DNA maturase B n=1 Tax=Chromobacterium amazonense TaxID=1382803 RepID=A0A2S9X535_9NEIS|nr:MULTISPECIES: phage terminase large subunit [Chromobacterium]OQS47808.1 DNA maturase B [Chromobacterium violaceum]OQS49938.1 DNA maturase B [Chromobacterium violaceum]PRP70834.1 DNA maturase B [Chromobacterium amazonense]